MTIADYEHKLAPLPGAHAIGFRHSDPRRYAFPLAFAAIVLVFALPHNLLVRHGFAFDAPGGNPLTKFHPATYVAILAVWFALYRARGEGGITGLFRERPALAWSISLTLLCVVHSLINFGISGVAVYVETYLVAMVVTVSLEIGTERQLSVLGYTILAFALINVAVSLLEGHTETHFLPIGQDLLDPIQGKPLDEGVDEFRGQAFYEHPLTGALVTSMALFMVLGMRLRGWITGAIFGFFSYRTNELRWTQRSLRLGRDRGPPYSREVAQGISLSRSWPPKARPREVDGAVQVVRQIPDRPWR
jgi:hypothetical protein